MDGDADIISLAARRPARSTGVAARNLGMQDAAVLGWLRHDPEEVERRTANQHSVEAEGALC